MSDSTRDVIQILNSLEAKIGKMTIKNNDHYYTMLEELSEISGSLIQVRKKVESMEEENVCEEEDSTFYPNLVSDINL